MTGTQAVRWLLDDLKFGGVVISASGDALAGQAHLNLGAHLAWGTLSRCRPNHHFAQGSLSPRVPSYKST